MSHKLTFEEQFEQSIPKQVNKNLKRFDLAVGDKIKHVQRVHDGKVREMRIDTYTILAIYPHVILCENKWHEKTTFTKIDYQTGVITRVEPLPDY